MSNELLWYLSRATGITSIALLTAVLLLGVVTSGRRRPVGERATILMGLHRWLSLGMVAFLGVHITTAIAETSSGDFRSRKNCGSCRGKSRPL